MNYRSLNESIRSVTNPKAKGKLGGLKGRGKYRLSIADPKNKMGT